MPASVESVLAERARRGRPGTDSRRKDLAYIEIPNAPNLDHAVHHEIRIGGREHALHDWLKSAPLFYPRKPCFSYDDESRMQLDIEQLDEIPRVRRHQGQITWERVMPEERVRLAAKAGMRNGQRIDTEFCGPPHELGG